MTLFLLISSIILLVSLGFLLKYSKDLRQWQAIVFVIVAPVLVAFIYPKIGTPEVFQSSAKQPEKTQKNIENVLTENELGPEQVQRAITSLQAKVEENPNDIESLNLLANTYLISEQAQLAVLTLEKLIALGQNDPDTLIKTADAYAFVENGSINLRAQQLLETAIQQDPNHPQGLWLAGMAAVQFDQLEQAKGYWNRLLPLIAGSPQEQQLKGILAELEQRQSTGKIATPNTANTLNDAEKPNIVSSQPKIIVNVRLSENLRQQNPSIKDEDTVFIFAQAQQGPKAPLAVKRLTVADLPATITLTEQDAMLPQATISQFQDIRLSAKISRSGDPTIKEGDIDSKPVDIDMLKKKDSYLLEIE